MKNSFVLLFTLLSMSGCELLQHSTIINKNASNLTGKGAVFLSWTASSNNPDHYLVEQSTDNVHFTQIQSVTVPQAQIENLAPSTYYFRVRASNSAGTSGYTSTVSIVIKS